MAAHPAHDARLRGAANARDGEPHVDRRLNLVEQLGVEENLAIGDRDEVRDVGR